MVIARNRSTEHDQQFWTHVEAAGADFASTRILGLLSAKERRIVSCLMRSMKNREIAAELGTTEQVIKNDLRKVFDKTGMSNRLELALFVAAHPQIYRVIGERKGVRRNTDAL